MEQTPVEWLVKQFDLTSDSPIIKNVVEQAKEKERMLSYNSALYGFRKALDEQTVSMDPNEYYNQTYKTKQL